MSELEIHRGGHEHADELLGFTRTGSFKVGSWPGAILVLDLS